jgi:prevent-host-death family protein
MAALRFRSEGSWLRGQTFFGEPCSPYPECADNRRFTRKTTTLMLELSNSVRIEQPEQEMKLTRDIQSLSTFKRDTAKLLRQMKKTKAPVVLTVNGKAELVVQDAESYQKLLEAKDRMEAIEGIQRGLESMKRNAGKPAPEFFREFFAEQRIPEE